MKPNASLEVRLVGRTGEPVGLSNVLVELHFYMNGNYRYAFKIGRTDQAGDLRVTFEDIEGFRSNHALQHLMDYNTRLEDCDPLVRVVIPSQEELNQQYRTVMKSYQVPPPWAVDWPSNTQQGQEKWVELGDRPAVITFQVGHMLG